MQKALLISVLIATFAVPVLAARRTPGDRRWRPLVAQFGIFAALYVCALLYVYPRLK